MIERGARMLVECIKTVKEKLPNDVLDQAQELYSDIKNKTLQWQYSGEVDKLRAAYLNSHPQPAVEQASVPK
jgi:hypothetical protein